MTRRDYVLIAAILGQTKPAEGTGATSRDAWQDAGAFGAWLAVCRKFAACLALENPRFDRARFLRACGVEP